MCGRVVLRQTSMVPPGSSRWRRLRHTMVVPRKLATQKQKPIRSRSGYSQQSRSESRSRTAHPPAGDRQDHAIGHRQGEQREPQNLMPRGVPGVESQQAKRYGKGQPRAHVAFGTEKRVLFIQRTWWLIEPARLRLSATRSMTWGRKHHQAPRFEHLLAQHVVVRTIARQNCPMPPTASSTSRRRAMGGPRAKRMPSQLLRHDQPGGHLPPPTCRSRRDHRPAVGAPRYRQVTSATRGRRGEPLS